MRLRSPALGASPRRRSRANETPLARLQLTSLIDIFTVLLLFLLKSVVVGGTVVTPYPGVKLPPSSATAPFRESPVVVIGTNQVLVDGASVGETGNLLAGESLRVPALATALAAVREKSESLAARGSKVGFTGRLIIQGDQAISFRELQKVMYTSQVVGFHDITLAVLQK